MSVHLHLPIVCFQLTMVVQVVHRSYKIRRSILISLLLLPHDRVFRHLILLIV